MPCLPYCPQFHTTREKKLNSHYHSPAPLSGNAPPHMEFSKSHPASQLLANNIRLSSSSSSFFLSLRAEIWVRKEEKKKEKKNHTSIISSRTFGTSEKKNNANTPAATPNDAAVIPLLCSLFLVSYRTFPALNRNNIAKRRGGGEGEKGEIMYYRRILLGPIPWMLGWIL